MTILEEIALRQSIMFGGIAVGLLFAVLYALLFCYRGPSWAKTGIKIIPVLGFAVAGYANFAAMLVVAGLGLSAVGDLALSRDTPKTFLFGLIAFAGAHILYILHFTDLGGVALIPLWAAGVVVALAVSSEVWLRPFTGAMKWPVRAYVVVITTMAVMALSLQGRELAMWGAMAFVVSDVILAIQVFRMKESARWQVPASVALWGLYVLGQCMILAGAGFARPLFSI